MPQFKDGKCRCLSWVPAFAGMTAAVLSALVSTASPARAGVDDCIEAALSAASPADMKKAAEFAANHSECLQDFVPPTTIPYVALSGALDVAKGKLGYGNSYPQCVAKLDPGKTVVKQLAPILKPICNKAGISAYLKCSDLEGAGAEELNAQAVSKIPILSLIPCGCAAATSGLGIDKLAELVKKVEACGGTLAKAGAYLAKGAEGAYSGGKKIVEGGGEVVKEGYCAVKSMFGGGCSKAAPPTGLSEAEKFCKSQGSTLKSAVSKTNKPDDYSVVCNNHAACVATPGKGIACQTAAEYQAHEDKLKAENEVWCAKHRDELKSKYDAKCRDGDCRFAAGLVIASYAAGCVKYANDSMDPFGEPTTNLPSSWIEEKKYVNSLDKLVDESIIRDPKAGRHEKLAAYGCKAFLGRDLEQLCPKGDAYGACKRYVDANELRACFEAGNPNSKYVSKAANDPNADITAQLKVNDCKPFLGRAGEWLCTGNKGLAICKDALAKGTVKSCHSPNDGRPATAQPVPSTTPSGAAPAAGEPVQIAPRKIAPVLKPRKITQ